MPKHGKESQTSDISPKLPVKTIFLVLLALLVGLIFHAPTAPSILESDQSKVSQSCLQYKTEESIADKNLSAAKEVYHWKCEPDTGPGFVKNIANSSARTSVDADLLAQEKVAYWTKIIGVLTAIGLWALIITLELTRRTTEVAQNAINTNRDIGQAQTRAYLSCSGGEWCVDLDGMVVRPEFQNFGQSPATEIYISQFALSIDAKINPNTNRIVTGTLAWLEESTFSTPMYVPNITASNSNNACFEFPASDYIRENIIVFLGTVAADEIEFFIDGEFSWVDVFGITQESHFHLRCLHEGLQDGSVSGTLSRKM